MKKAGLGKIGLLGTRYTMEQDFYTRRLAEQHRLEVIVPGFVILRARPIGPDDAFGGAPSPGCPTS